MSYNKILEEEYEKKINEVDEEETPIVDTNNIDFNLDDAFLLF